MGFSTGGLAALVAYWMFATDLFDAQHPVPSLCLFPHHHDLLKGFLADSPQERIAGNPGSVEALLVMGIWLHTQSRLLAPSAKPDFMSHHHLLTLVAVFHPNPRVRQSAVTLAGAVLHAAPEDERLSILEDLLENCVFASLQSCAVSWVKDEIMTATKNGANTHDASNRFANADCIETLQYALFPDLTHLQDEAQDRDALLEFWAQAWPFHLQVANFAQLLFGGGYGDMVPAGMAAGVEQRYVEPLVHMAGVLRGAEKEGEGLGTLDILTNALEKVSLSDGQVAE